MSAPNFPNGSPSATTGRKSVLYTDEESFREDSRKPLPDETCSMAVVTSEAERQHRVGFAYDNFPSAQNDSNPSETIIDYWALFSNILGDEDSANGFGKKITWEEAKAWTNNEWGEKLSKLADNNDFNYRYFLTSLQSFPGAPPLCDQLPSFQDLNNEPHDPKTDSPIRKDIRDLLEHTRQWIRIDLTKLAAPRETLNFKVEDHDNLDVDSELFSLGVHSEVEMWRILRPIRKTLLALLHVLYRHHMDCSSDPPTTSTNAHEPLTVENLLNQPDVMTLHSDIVDDDLFETPLGNFAMLRACLEYYFDRLMMYQNLVFRYVCERYGPPEPPSVGDVAEEAELGEVE